MRPTLSSAVLLRTVTRIAAAPEVWSRHVRFDLAERCYTRLHRDDDYEVWLICWELGQDTLLHDHGGSVGAFAVISGTLIEDYAMPNDPTLRTRSLVAGSSATFGARYLHNLVNVATEPAVSVHAYSRPLRTMNFYCWLPSGAHHLREVACDCPEPDTTDLERVAGRLAAAHQ